MRGDKIQIFKKKLLKECNYTLFYIVYKLKFTEKYIPALLWQPCIQGGGGGESTK